MKYYKIVIDKEIKGVVNSFNFFVENSGSLISSTDSLGQFVEYEGQLYRDYWMPPIPNNKRQFLNASITEISREDYFIYLRAKQANESIIIDDDEENIPDPIIPPNIPEEPDEMLEFIRSSKLNEMSHACRTTIESGIDLEIRGETKHFSLTTQDQLNLMSAQSMAQTQTLIPYHADGEETDFYTNEEINQIVEAAAAFKVQHTTYYNSLKTYINALETIEEISAITYGVEIPDEYKSDVLKVLEQ